MGKASRRGAEGPYGTLYGWMQAAKNGDLDIEERTPENAMSLAEEIRSGSCEAR